jgi:hypothetical protein
MMLIARAASVAMLVSLAGPSMAQEAFCLRNHGAQTVYSGCKEALPREGITPILCVDPTNPKRIVRPKLAEPSAWERGVEGKVDWCPTPQACSNEPCLPPSPMRNDQ